MMPAARRARIAADILLAGRAGPVGLSRRRDARLQALVRHARTSSPFYRHLYRGLPPGPVALQDLPPVSKPQLMASFDDWVTDPRITLQDVQHFLADPARVGQPYLGCFACTTSGTTGHPGILLHDGQATAVYQAMTLRLDLAWLGAAEWVELARKGMRWAGVVGTGAHYGGVGWMEWERRRSRVRRHCYRAFSVQQPLRDLTAALQEFDPAILTGYPSALLQLAAEQQAGRLRLRPTVVQLAGESTSPEQRARIAAALGGALHDTYACSEFLGMTLDCREGWLHAMGDWVILEPVDAEMRPVPPGRFSSTVLLTNLANRVQPIIRYDLGDSVLTRPDPCPCGSPMPAIRVAGRQDDILQLDAADGRVVEVLPLAIGSVLDQTPGLRRSQLRQVGRASLVVRLEPDPGADAEQVWQDTRARLGQYLAELGLPGVDILRAAEAPEPERRSGKFRQVIAGRW
jgi:phenylacetate-CoA ligase